MLQKFAGPGIGTDLVGIIPAQVDAVISCRPVCRAAKCKGIQYRRSPLVEKHLKPRKPSNGVDGAVQSIRHIVAGVHGNPGPKATDQSIKAHAHEGTVLKRTDHE
jgi:hypothetical protein